MIIVVVMVIVVVIVIVIVITIIIARARQIVTVILTMACVHNLLFPEWKKRNCT